MIRKNVDRALKFLSDAVAWTGVAFMVTGMLVGMSLGVLAKTVRRLASDSRKS